MTYPGGYDDTKDLNKASLQALAGREIPWDLWVQESKKEGLPLFAEQNSVRGPALPLLLLMEGRGGKAPEDFPRAYYSFLEEVLRDPQLRGSVAPLMAKLAGLQEKKARSPSPPPAERKPPLPPEGGATLQPSAEQNPPLPPEGGGTLQASPPEEEKATPQGGESHGQKGEELQALLTILASALAALGERVQRLETEVAQALQDLESLGETVLSIREEIRTWNDHVRYLNDRYDEVQQALEKGQEQSQEKFKELAARVGEMDNLIKQIHRVVAPK